MSIELQTPGPFSEEHAPRTEGSDFGVIASGIFVWAGDTYTRRRSVYRRDGWHRPEQRRLLLRWMEANPAALIQTCSVQPITAEGFLERWGHLARRRA